MKRLILSFLVLTLVVTTAFALTNSVKEANSNDTGFQKNLRQTADISVNPSEFAVTLEAGESSTEYLTITNNGQGQLDATLSIGTNRMRSETPELIYGQAQDIKDVYSELSPNESLIPSTKNIIYDRSGSYSILYVTAVGGGDSTFKDAISNLSTVSVFDEINAIDATPNVAYMLQYDLVIVAANNMFSDPTLLGNNLATYSDAGGKIILLQFSIAGNTRVQGNIRGTAYMPLAALSTNSSPGSGTSFISHPITQDVSLISTDYSGHTQLQGDGISLGSYTNGNPIVAYNPNKPIVAINVYPVNGAWGGDFIQMVSNTISWLSSTWISLAETEISIAPGTSETIEVTIDSGVLRAGTYSQAIKIASNDPDQPQLNIPVIMIVVEPLVADFTAVEPTIYLGESIALTSSSTGTIIDYLWDFGDGNSSTEASPSYTYIQSGSYSVTLTISNAISSEFLTKTNYITVNDAPDIAVDPAEFDVTLGAGGSSTEYLTITNNGEELLNASLSIGANSERTDSYSVLYINTLRGADSNFRTALSNVSAFTEFNAETGTPTVAYMQDYDVVIVSTYFAISNSILLGNNLATYCDAGGKLIVLGGSFGASSGQPLSGSIIGTDYMPLAVTTSTFTAVTGNNFISHPITQNVSTISTDYYAQTSLQGDGVSLGSYSYTSNPIVAYNSNKPIVAINVFTYGNYWGGDFIQMVENSINWLGGASDWLALSATELAIAPGASEIIEVTLTSGTLAFGDYTETINISSNDPDSPLLSIPVTMTVVEPLVPNFTASEPTIYLGESIVFTSSSTGTITDYLWDFGDGNTSTEVSPSYTYTLSGLYSVTLTISNAISSEFLTKTNHITVNDAPDIAVDPAEFDVTLGAGGSSTEYLTITNNGEGLLNASLSIGSNRERGGIPEIIYGQARSGDPIISGLNSSKKLIPSTKNITSTRTGNYSILYVTSILESDGSAFIAAINELDNVSLFEVFNANTATPNVAYMLQYDLVIVSSNYPINEPEILGNNLASYCDAGGKLIFLQFSIGGTHLVGTITGTDYLPLAVTNNYLSATVNGSNFISHPITEDISAISTGYYAQTYTQGDGISLGSYTTGYPVVAYNPNKPIVAINVLPYNSYWGGDFIQMVSNTINWLGGASDWLALSATELAIAPGASETIEVSLTSGTLAFGDYTETINISSNDPDSPLLSIPVTMTVVEPLVPNFTASEPTIYLGESIVFTSSSTGTITDYLWDFGDGNTSTEVSPSYTYTLSGLYSVTLTISNAISSEFLTKTNHITVNDAPDIAVDPAEFDVTLGAGGSSTEYMTITNNGQGLLNASLSIGANRERGGIPEISYGQARNTESIIPGLSSSKKLIPSTKNITSDRTDSYSILYVNALYNSDSAFKTAITNLSNVSLFEDFNAETGTPNVAYMLQYDLVIVSSGSSFSNPTLLGNNLAAYCDAGGKLIALGASFYSGGGWALGGTISGPDYLPLSTTNYDYSTATGTNFISHPITNSVSQMSTTIWANTYTQGDGVSLGTYTNGYPIAAYNPNKPIVAINVYPASNSWGGDLIQMVSNTINWLGGASDWLAVSATELAIAPGDSEIIEVTLTSGTLAFGSYTQAIMIASNDPDSPLLNIPVTMIVADMLVADFAAVEPTIYLGESIEFTCSSTGSIDDYLWDFGDGNTSTEVSPSYTYTLSGVYSVTLTITNAISSDTITKTDYITVNGVADIAVNPAEFNVTLAAGGTSVEYMTITNNGEGDLEWELVIGNASRAFEKSDGFRRPASQRNMPAIKNTRNSNDASISAIRSERYFNTNKSRSNNVLIFRDNLAWGYNVNVPVLESLGVTISIANASDMSTVDLSAYDLILFESEQSQSFYSNYVANKIRFENYLSSGGVIEFHTQANYASNMQFPGEMTFLSGGTNDYNNYISDATHPIVSGLVAPLYGTAASHGAFANLPSGSNTIVINESGFPTMVEYQYGLGRVLATTMCLEFNYENSHSSGALLPRLLEYSLGVEQHHWLTASLSSGTIPAGSSIDVELNINSENLEAATYTKAIQITSNDPNEPTINIPVTLTLVEELVVEPAIGTLYISEVSHSGNANTQYMELYNNSDDLMSLSNLTLRMSGGSSASFLLNNSDYLGDRVVLPRNYFVISSYADRATFETALGTLPEGVTFLKGEAGMLFGVGAGYRWELVLNTGAKEAIVIDDTGNLVGGENNTSYQASPGLWVYESSSVGTPGAPHLDQTLPVTLSSFTAVQTSNNLAQITWQTASESGILGYNLYRAETANQDDAIRVTATMIEATNSQTGSNYSYIDAEIEIDVVYNYWLQINDFEGSSSMVGPVTLKISIDDDNHDIEDMLLGTQLFANYPNPFNPSTTISFSVAEPQVVTIDVYNVKGQLVKRVFNSNVAEINTKHNVVWNGKDSTGQNVASGIYFTIMKVGKKSFSNKAILMK